MAKLQTQRRCSPSGRLPDHSLPRTHNRGYLERKYPAPRSDDAMRELGYRPNAIARSLQGQRSQMVGLIFPTVANPFYGEMVYRLESYLAEEGYRVILCNSDGHPEQESATWEMLFSTGVDGIIQRRAL